MERPAKKGFMVYPACQQAVGHPEAFLALDHPAHCERFTDCH